MSFRVTPHHSYDHHDRRNVIAMEEFCQLMESPMLFQQQQQVHQPQPHLSRSDSFYNRPEHLPQFSFSDSFGSRAHHRPEPQPQLSFTDSFGSRAHYRPEPQPQLSFSDSFGHSQRLPEARYSQVQAPECNLLTVPVKHHSIGEASIDKEAGEFIKMRHKKFNLSK
ncbi:hypothetical protein QQ045_017272 [Rhodiola kirilowii]